MNLLEVRDLRKKYSEVEAVKGISFDIREGEIFALIGPNGAGKTTTLRMICTLLNITGGDILISGINVREEPAKARRLITYLPEEAGAYKNMKGASYLRFMADLCTDNREEADKAFEFAKVISGLGSRLNDKISSYSKGMTRKLLLSRAVMTKPKLAILDEPTSGLDIINGMEIRHLIKQLAKDEGMSFLISSHNMLEIQYLSDSIGIISGGVIYDIGVPQDMLERHQVSNLEEVFRKVVAV